MTDDKALSVQEGSQVSLGQMTFSNPSAVIAAAKEVATSLTGMIRDLGLYSNINGKEYVRVEGWTTLGAMLGVTPRTVSVEEIEPGVFEAVVEIVTADGKVIGRGIAECGSLDEVDRSGNPVWGNRARYARKSMAITRATGKAYRLSYSWIIKMAGYESTPAEEMDGVIEGSFAPASAPVSGNPGTVLVPFQKAKKLNGGNAPDVAWLFAADKEYCQWIVSNKPGDIADAINAYADSLAAGDVIEGEPVRATGTPGSDEIYTAVVTEGLSENYFSAKAALEKCRTGYATKVAAISWMKFYRGWRDLGKSPDAAADLSNAGQPPVG